MKHSLGALAVLLFLTALAVGQQLQSPFPAAANPSLTDNRNEATLPTAVDRRYAMPPAMAANEAGAVADQGDIVSSFPAAANPSLAKNTNEETTVVVDHSFQGHQSPFPSAANPSK